MSRCRQVLYRSSVGASITLAIALSVLAFGQLGRTTTSYARILPPPAKPSRIVSPPPSTDKITNGPMVDLSNASNPARIPTPTRLVIPAIGVDTSVVALGRNADGGAQVPSGTTYASWYDLGPRPGQLGPAVILGHVDSYSGPGGFFRLRGLLPGDEIMGRAG